MDWLTQYRATIDCQQKTVTLITPEGETVLFKGGNAEVTIPVISAVKACKLKGKGCSAYLCAVEVQNTQEPDLKNTPIAQGFRRSFSESAGIAS